MGSVDQRGATTPPDSTVDAQVATVSPTGGWWKRSWPYALILLVGGFVLLPELGQFGFWDPWEPKYAEAAREMAERDSYVVPYYRDAVRLTKPILVYWGILLGSALFGLDEFGARIVGVGFALASMAGVFYAVSLLRGRRAGLLAALVLATLPQFYFISRQAMPDVYLFTTLGTGLLFLALGLFGPDRRRTPHFVIAYVGFALALLAKGPVIVGTIVVGVPMAPRRRVPHAVGDLAHANELVEVGTECVRLHRGRVGLGQRVLEAVLTQVAGDRDLAAEGVAATVEGEGCDIVRDRPAAGWARPARTAASCRPRPSRRRSWAAPPAHPRCACASGRRAPRRSAPPARSPHHRAWLLRRRG